MATLIQDNHQEKQARTHDKPRFKMPMLVFNPPTWEMLRTHWQSWPASDLASLQAELETLAQSHGLNAAFSADDLDPALAQTEVGQAYLEALRHLESWQKLKGMTLGTLTVAGSLALFSYARQRDWFLYPAQGLHKLGQVFKSRRSQAERNSLRDFVKDLAVHNLPVLLSILADEDEAEALAPIQGHLRQDGRWFIFEPLDEGDQVCQFTVPDLLSVTFSIDPHGPSSAHLLLKQALPFN